MSVNLSSRVRGSGAAHFKGLDFWAKDVMAVDFDLKPFDVSDDAWGQLSSRMGGRMVKVTFTPDGVWTALALAILYPYLNARLGDFNTPVRPISAVNTTTGNMVSANHGQLTGTGIRFASAAGGVIPAGLSATTTYYLWANADGNTFQIYDTEAHALAANGTTVIAGQVIPSSAGSGSFSFVHNSPFTITTQDGVQMIIWNAAITVMPGGSLGSTVSTMKQVTVEGYTLSGLNWSDANSIVSYNTGVVLTALPPNQAQIPTVPYTIDWATRLPVASANTGTGVLSLTNHGLTTGQAVTADTISLAGVLPAPLTAGTTYYVIAVDANDIKLATTLNNANAGTSITLTSAGTEEFDIVSSIQLEGMKPREAIDVDFGLTWADVPSEEGGVDCRSLTNVKITVSFVPTNVDFGTLLNAFALQGGTAARGQALPSANMDIYGPGDTPFIRIYGATLQNPPARFGKQADRVDKLTFVSTRVFRGSTPEPFGYVGLAAPTV